MTIHDTADRIVSALFDQAESDGGLIRDKLVMRVTEVMSEAASAKEQDAPKPAETIEQKLRRAMADMGYTTNTLQPSDVHNRLNAQIVKERTEAEIAEIRRSMDEARVQMDAEAKQSGWAILSNMNNAGLVQVGRSITEHRLHSFAQGLLSASSVTMPADMSAAIAAAAAKRKCFIPG